MLVTSLLSRREFDHETVAKMSVALEVACETLGLAPKDDQVTRLVAEKIIELTQRGVTDVIPLTKMTVRHFKQTK